MHGRGRVAALDSATRTAAAATTVDNAVADTVAADVCSGGGDHRVTITVVVIPEQVERRTDEVKSIINRCFRCISKVTRLRSA